MLIIEPLTGKIVDANPAACNFYGYTNKEILNKHIQNINMLPKEEVEKFRLLALNETQRHFIFPHRLKSGDIKLVDVYSCPITYNNERLLFSIIFDVTDREKFKEDLSREKELLQITLSSIGDGVVTTDNTGKIISLNKVAQEITGWHNEDANDKLFSDVFKLKNENTGKDVENPIQKVLQTGKIIDLANHTVLINTDGQPVPYFR